MHGSVTDVQTEFAIFSLVDIRQKKSILVCCRHRRRNDEICIFLMLYPYDILCGAWIWYSSIWLSWSRRCFKAPRWLRCVFLGRDDVKGYNSFKQGAVPRIKMFSYHGTKWLPWQHLFWTMQEFNDSKGIEFKKEAILLERKRERAVCLMFTLCCGSFIMFLSCVLFWILTYRM